MTKKYVYNFSEGNKDMRSLLGGKGANLAEMKSLGINVPPGFTITTESCNSYYENGERIKPEILKQINDQLETLEKEIGKKLGSLENPLLVSVRSGAVFSMPGMMDTILNLGLNDETTIVLAKKNNNYRFAYDSYRRFIQMFSDVVMNVEKYKFEEVLTRVKEENGYTQDSDMNEKDLFKVVEEFKAIYRKEVGRDFPMSVKEQLMLAVEAVFKSWNNNRAKVYRRLHNISDKLGTAVNIQAMVFGNMGDNCGTGVSFSRNPVTGEDKLFGEYLINAQGEDVVAGIRTPKNISILEEDMPHLYEEFVDISKKLERHYKDMQDIEFTIEDGKLYILQTRNAKRTPNAVVEVAVSLVEEGIISKEEAILRIGTEEINKLLHATFEEKSLKGAKELTQGLAASPGAAVGKIYFSAEEAVEAAKTEAVVLVREETSPEDIEGMVSSEAIVTLRGGMTSHAAVVARGMGKCCVCGCQNMIIDYKEKTLRISDLVLREGDTISVDGSSGKVYLGEVEKVDATFSSRFKKLLCWADEIRQMSVFANADNEIDAKVAFEFGAEGIGLCRTEHMFFKKDKIWTIREFILSDRGEEKEKALKKLHNLQKEDFLNIFKILNGDEANIRLLDPPVHEFLPKTLEDKKKMAEILSISLEDIEKRIYRLKDENPMLGHRGCRLGVSYPELYRIQARAIIEAAYECEKKGIKVHPEIMIPFIMEAKELEYLREEIQEEIENFFKEVGATVEYKLGTMIEIPRACLLANEIAEYADFFSFGTNDLTQMSMGLSRDDSVKFLDAYREKGIWEGEPFYSIDTKAVTKLVEFGVKNGKIAKPNLKIGVCGEHGGDPKSIEFFEAQKFDYVSCSPFRVPTAILAAAQSYLKLKK